MMCPHRASSFMATRRPSSSTPACGKPCSNARLNRYVQPASHPARSSVSPGGGFSFRVRLFYSSEYNFSSAPRHWSSSNAQGWKDFRDFRDFLLLYCKPAALATYTTNTLFKCRSTISVCWRQWVLSLWENITVPAFCCCQRPLSFLLASFWLFRNPFVNRVC